MKSHSFQWPNFYHCHLFLQKKNPWTYIRILWKSQENLSFNTTYIQRSLNKNVCHLKWREKVETIKKEQKLQYSKFLYILLCINMISFICFSYDYLCVKKRRVIWCWWCFFQGFISFFLFSSFLVLFVTIFIHYKFLIFPS